MSEPGPDDYTARARHFTENGSYSKAFDIYMHAFDKWPDLKTRAESEFRGLLEKYNEYLLTSNKIGDIFYNFERSIECFPGNIFILNDIGRYLYKFGYLREACCHFQKALNFNVGYVSAEKNMNSVKNMMVERWHFRMLNDKIRNGAYHKALHESIDPMKDTILDLGTGSGLLAMYANERLPMMITACDGSETMIEIARFVMEANRVEDVILVNKMSTSLSYCDIGGKRTLIVTELFDVGLFGENILQTLVHAWEHLMAKGARVIPAKAEFFVVGVKSDYLCSRYRLTDAVLKLLKTSSQNVHVASLEPYDSEDVHLLKDIKYITDVKSVLKINFNDIDDIQKKLNNEKPYKLALKANEDTEINAIIGWFNLYLTDTITITTNPVDENRADAWQQALFCDIIPTSLKKNDIYTLEFTSYGGKITLMQNENRDIDRVSPEMIRFLNDTEYVRMITNSIGTVFIYLCQIVEVSQLYVLDMCPFPLLGFMLMKRGAQSLSCYAKTLEDKDFILKVFAENNIPETNVTVILDEELSMSCFKDKKYHVIYTNILELSGDLDVKQKSILKEVKKTHMFTGALILPFKVTLEGQLIYSHWLEKNNIVNDENVNNYLIAKFINKYQVSQNFHLDIEHLEYTPISEVTEIAVCSEEMPPKVIKLKVVKDGQVNSILCWYKIQLLEKGEIMSTKRGNCYIDATAFRAHPKITMKVGKIANILRCVDDDDSYKLLTDVE